MRVHIENAAQQPSRVEVVQLASGQTLYYETYRTAAYGHRFDFDGVPVGRYLVRFKVGRNRYRYTVQVNQDPQTGTTVAVQGLNSYQAKPVLAAAMQ